MSTTMDDVWLSLHGDWELDSQRLLIYSDPGGPRCPKLPARQVAADFGLYLSILASGVAMWYLWPGLQRLNVTNKSARDTSQQIIGIRIPA